MGTSRLRNTWQSELAGVLIHLQPLNPMSSNQPHSQLNPVIPISLPELTTLHSDDEILQPPDWNKMIFIVLVTSSFSWTRNGTHFDVEKDSKVLMKPGSGTLVIDISGEKAEAYEGTYQCTAHNEHGTAVSNNIVIRQSSKTSHCIQFYKLNLSSSCRLMLRCT